MLTSAISLALQCQRTFNGFLDRHRLVAYQRHATDDSRAPRARARLKRQSRLKRATGCDCVASGDARRCEKPSPWYERLNDNACSTSGWATTAGDNFRNKREDSARPVTLDVDTDRNQTRRGEVAEWLKAAVC